MSIRVRFAPSPTGELHIGSARTALFNWLFARHHNGAFILRIENTDTQRSQQDYTRSILENLQWLGLDWNEGPEIGGQAGPYYQSERLQIYRDYAAKLMADGEAYQCYCTLEELEARKSVRQQKGQPIVYDGKCRSLTAKERQGFLAEGRRPTIRFHAKGTGDIQINDVLRGNVQFDNTILGDFIILRSDGSPTYNFANVVDDALMGITHVIRGDDHLSNTPRQVLIYNSLKFDLPVFVHIPMILGADGAKLSKRHGAQSLTYYREQGYYPWAVANYLALLGWATSESKQFFGRDELIDLFSLDRLNKSAATFDIQKLDSINAHYIREMSIDELSAHVMPYLRGKGWIQSGAQTYDTNQIARIVELAQDRIHRFPDIIDVTEFFFNPDFAYDQRAVRKRLSHEFAMGVLAAVKQRLLSSNLFTESSLEETLRSLSAELQLSTGKVFHVVRVALTGKMTGPGLFQLAILLGRQEVIRRLARTIELLQDRKAVTAESSYLPIGGLSNGRTPDSGSGSEGSNPSPPANITLA